jgi:uncharacterized protein (TIGR03118 family)
MLRRLIRSKRAQIAVLSVIWLSVSAHSTRAQDNYHRINLVSDIPGVALRTDPNLINPWGIAFSAAGPIWIADNNSGKATVYQADGQGFPLGSPLVVTVPPPHGSNGQAAPTGIVFNGTNGFVVSAKGNSGPSIFIFDTEDGTISGWNPGVDLANAILVVDNSKPGGVDNSTLGAVYKGLAIAPEGKQTFIFAANFRDGIVEKYNSNFKLVKKFTDSNLPKGFAPFGIRALQGHLFVTFAKQNAAKHDDVAGPGSGFVDIFDTEGALLKRFASEGTLNAPWGLAEAPQDFGKFGDALLVGNFGDGRINAFEDETGAFLGQLTDDVGQPLTINGLWGLAFGNGGLAGATSRLLFTAGIGDESHGLFGVIRPAVPDDLQDQLQ